MKKNQKISVEGAAKVSVPFTLNRIKKIKTNKELQKAKEWFESAKKILTPTQMDAVSDALLQKQNEMSAKASATAADSSEILRDKLDIKTGKPIKRTVKITLTLKEAALALDYKKWAKDEYLHADPYEDVYHGGYTTKDLEQTSEPSGMEGVNSLFPVEAVATLEDCERDGYAKAITEARYEAICKAFEMVAPAGEYESGDGEMISVRDCGIKCQIDPSKNEVVLEIKNPEHLINDIVAGVGYFAPEIDPYEKASDKEIKDGIIANAGDYFDVYGEGKPSSDLDKRFMPHVDEKLYKVRLKERISDLGLSEIAECVKDAVEDGRVEDLEKAAALAAKFTGESKEAIVNKIKKVGASMITKKQVLAELSKMGIEVKDGKVRKSDLKRALD